MLVDENEFDLAKEAFRELLTEIAAEGKEDEETRGEKKKEIERELARVKQFQKRALEEMRNKFRGKECVQVFLHYNNRKTPGAKDNMFDKRPHLGLPSWFKR